MTKNNEEPKISKEATKKKVDPKVEKVDPKVEKVDPKVEKVDPKVDVKKLKDENKKLNEQIRNLINQVNELKINNEASIASFQEKAKGFQTKAQEEVNKVKEELRLKAEEENNEFKKYGLQKTFENIIEPLINIEVAIKAGKNQGMEVQAYVMGFDMLITQLLSELEGAGLVKIEPKVTDEFNPELHQAISTREGEVNKILEVKKPGFKLHDRVIKPATVIIGK